MPQNLISIVIDDALAAELAATAQQLEDLLAGKTVSLAPEDRRGGLKMGDKSEAFCRQTIGLLAQNRQVVPPSLQLDEALADLKALDAIRPLLLRLQQLTERLRDTEMALGADLMSAAVEGYGLLKLVGRQQGLDGPLKELGARWARSARKPEPELEPDPEPAAA